jgi:tRNA A37 threonylcarbamoyladenosine dehydratase
VLNQFSRTELVFGAGGVEKLKNARVAVFGVGGVGGYTVEALARSGVGALDIVDDDKICLTNLNRQIIALHSTIGRYKVDVAQQRINDINPDCKVTTHQCFFLPDTADQFDFSAYDYVVDAVDTVTAKLALIEASRAAGTPIISSMGAGNKIDPTRFEVADIYDTSVDPLAKVMRKECRKRGIDALKVVYSKEPPRRPREDMAASCKTGCVCPPGTQRTCLVKNQIPGSTAFVPSAVGLIIASVVVCDLLNINAEGA